MDKKIVSGISNDAWLRVGTLVWSRFPASFQQEPLDGVKRVARITADITAKAKVDIMPPVEIVAQVWLHGETATAGTCTLLKIRHGTQYGARLPAPTAVCEDEPVVRSILVHEFAHAFGRLIWLWETPSESPLLDDHDVFDAAQDDAHLVNPFDWFSDDDAQLMSHHNDEGVNAATCGKIIDCMKYLKPHGPYARPTSMASWRGRSALYCGISRSKRAGQALDRLAACARSGMTDGK
jgi:hypothetical protein